MPGELASDRQVPVTWRRASVDLRPPFLIVSTTKAHTVAWGKLVLHDIMCAGLCDLARGREETCRK